MTLHIDKPKTAVTIRRHVLRTYCLLTHLNDYLLNQFVGNMLLGTGHSRLRQQIYGGEEFIQSLRYPFIKLSQKK